MNISESTMNAIRQLLTAFFAVLAGLGLHGLDSATAVTLANAISVALPALISIGSIIWSIVVHYGKKKVPNASVALELPASVRVPPVGEKLDLAPVTGLAKVVG